MALLFALNNYIERRTDRGTSVGTDESCSWSKPRKASVPVTVEHLDYRRNRGTPRKPGPTPKNYTPIKEVTEEKIFDIQEHLKMVNLCRRKKKNVSIYP